MGSNEDFCFFSFYNTGLNIFIGQGKDPVERGRLNIQEGERIIHRASSRDRGQDGRIWADRVA